MVIVFKKEKTNWKYLLIVFVIGFAVGVGVIYMANMQIAETETASGMGSM